MKICSVCNETYRDDEQNYCLIDGSVLTKVSDDAPPTVFMNQARTTDQTNWGNNNPLSGWQNQPLQQNQSFPLAAVQGQNQVLPTVSLVLGILGFVLVCCYGGIPLGIGAVVTGYLGLSNANKNPMQYGGRGLAIAGLILGGFALLGSLIMIIFAIIGSIN